MFLIEILLSQDIGGPRSRYRDADCHLDYNLYYCTVLSIIQLRGHKVLVRGTIAYAESDKCYTMDLDEPVGGQAQASETKVEIQSTTDKKQPKSRIKESEASAASKRRCVSTACIACRR